MKTCHHDDQTYIGSIDVDVGYADGPITLEMIIINESDGRCALEIGPYRLGHQAICQLFQLLSIPLALMEEPNHTGIKPPDVSARRRAEKIWRFDMARNAKGVSLNGETLP